MDANGQRFWSLSDANHWHPWPLSADAPSGVEYDAERRILRLANQRPAPQVIEVRADAVSYAERPAQARDAFGTRAWWDAASTSVLATGARSGNAKLPLPVADKPPSDLAMGYDDVLYVARSGPVQLLDLRGRWASTEVSAPDFAAHKLSADAAGGIWALDRGRGQLARLTGLPPMARPYALNVDSFRRCANSAEVPVLKPWPKAKLPAEESAITLAASPNGRVALLSWKTDADARLRLLTEDGGLSAPLLLKGLKHPYALTWIDDAQIAVMVTGAQEALAYQLPASVNTAELDLFPTGDFYPLVQHDGQPFMHGVDLPPHYPSSVGEGSKPLLSLSLPGYARRGQAANYPADYLQPNSAVPLLIDGELPATQWHRVYLEASLPPGTGLRLWLAATALPQPPTDEAAWHLHGFGAAALLDAPAGTPRGAWLPQASELPFHPGLSICPRERDRSGLFTALVQRAGKRVRTLTGRYLWLRAELIGNGRQTPEIAALRVYGSRFSYRDRYLPELYRENVFGPDANEAASATPADFLGRFLDNFEGLLTPLEDRIAAAYLLTDPLSTPSEALPWLGTWVGMAFEDAWSDAQRRTLLQAAPLLYRLHGTLAGLRAMLEIATGGALHRARLTQVGDDLPVIGEVAVVSDGSTSSKGLVISTRGIAGAGEVTFLAGGAVSGGEIVVIENFRMRRVFATILGADLQDANDPLLAGIVQSGNSFVGDTLFLGREDQKQFLALYADTLVKTASEEKAIAALYDDLAFRISILVHQQIEPQSFGLIRRVAMAAAPAHVELQLLQATYPFLVSVASLVAVDTYLGNKPQTKPVRINGSLIGVRDVLKGVATLDPRFESGGFNAATPPVAVIEGPEFAEAGESFALQATRSEAAAGRRINQYVWTWEGQV